jgi:hypothetical protein
MLPIIWTSGSVLVLILIISFLPLGFTLKGKFFIVLASFVLALGGLAAVSSFPLWETALMLIALIFFTAYFMDNRIGALLFKEIPSFENEQTNEIEIPVDQSKIDIKKNNNSLELTELELVEPAAIKLKDNYQPLVQKVTEEVFDEDISFLERIDEEEKSYDDTGTKKIMPLVDPAFDFLFATEEVAVGQGNVQEEINLQK